MSLLIDAVYALLLVLSSPVLLYKARMHGKYREGWRQKLLGRAPLRIGENPCLWLHAVSVGEVLLLRPLVEEFARRRPDWEVVISTTTQAGLGVARRTFPDRITFYAPLDFSWAVRRAVARVRPNVLALVELELWPNWIRAARDAGASVCVINGRITERSHRGYRRIRGLLRPTLRALDFVAAQSEEYADRFLDLGLPKSRVRVTGSIKFDGLESDRDAPRIRQLRRDLELDPSDIVFVAGSTMEGEERAALDAFRAARAKHPGLRLVLVPRHPERFDAVAERVLRAGERLVRRGEPGVVRGEGQAPPVLLVDSVGELSAVWGLADLAYVGGSLFPGRGGQNMMEPAAYGAAVSFGPHTVNFREIVEHLKAREAATVVTTPRDLAVSLLRDLDDPEAAAARGEAARRFVLAQHGAAARTFAEIDRLVEPKAQPALASACT